MHAFETIGLAALVFATTNVDDFFLLLALFADGRSRKRQIVMGQYLGVGALVILSLGIAWGTILLPRQWIGLLGILPLSLGVKDLIQLRKPVDPEKRQHLVDTALLSRRSTLAIAGITIASGADNVAAYAPLFATMHNFDLGLMVVTFSCLVAGWCICTHWLVKVGYAAIRRERRFKFVTPVVLILLGIWILSKVVFNRK